MVVAQQVSDLVPETEMILLWCRGEDVRALDEIAKNLKCSTRMDALSRVVQIAQENLIGVARDDLAATSEALWMDEN